MEFNNYVSILAWLCIAFGYFRRRQRVQHVQWMLTGISVDVALFIYSRISDFLRVGAKLSQLELAYHLVTAATVVLYVPVVILGTKLLLLGSVPVVREYHVRFAVLALLFRQVDLVLMLILVLP